jgi:hypothetical protein
MLGTCKSGPLRAIRNSAQYKYFLIASALSCGLPIATSAQTTTPAQTAPQLWSAKIPFNGFQRIATLLHSDRFIGPPRLHLLEYR